jgi:hypothetical protein
MSTSGTSFDLILEEVLKQKRVLEELQAENEALRQQLADLRAGKGISIDIEGQRFPLHFEDQTFLNEAAPDASQKEVHTPSPEEVPSLPVGPVSEGATAILNEVHPEEAKDTSGDFLLEEVSDNGTPFPATASSFLEEAMLEEFASASTRQMNVWSGPITDHPTLDEHEKASLRRELMGSFLLE